MNRLHAWLLVGSLVVALGCRDNSGPTAGTLKIRLQMPAATSGLDGAILLTLKGPAQLTSAQVGTGLQVFYTAFGADSTRFAMTGTLSGNADILTIGVPDVRQVGQYTARVDQVASSSGYQLRALSGYSLSVTR
jgi:hypothetical protein